MPIEVNIPLHICVDPHAVSARSACIEDGIIDALTRALINSRQQILLSREEYESVFVNPPDIRWCGEGLHELLEDQRIKLEHIIASSIQTSLSNAKIESYDRPRTNTSPVIPSEVFEAVDYERMYSPLKLYEIPSYDEPRKKRIISFEEGATISEKKITVPTPAWAIRDLDKVTRRELDRLISIAVKKYGLIRSGDYYGFILLGETGRFYIVMAPRSGGKARRIEFDRTFTYEIKKTNGREDWVKVPYTPRPAKTTIRVLADFNNLVQRITAIRAYMGDSIRATLIAYGRKHRLTTEASFKEQLEKRVEAEVRKRANDYENDRKPPTHLLEVNFGGVIAYVPIRFKGPPFKGVGVLLPLFTLKETEVGKKEGKGEGVGGEKGKPGTGVPGEGEEGAGTGPGGVIDTGESGDTKPGPLFPPSYYGIMGGFNCISLLGEPPLEDLGADGEALRRQIAVIAQKLQVPACEHAARFCVEAAEAIGSRASRVASYSVVNFGFTQPVAHAQPNMGIVDFRPVASPAVQFMRYLASVVPLISQLSDTIRYIYAKSEHRVHFTGTWRNAPNGWNLRFLMEFTPAIKKGIGFLFGLTCQVYMLQLLRSSAIAINARLNNPVYARNFEQVIVPQLFKLQELIDLREKLKALKHIVVLREGLKHKGVSTFALSAASGSLGAWLEATRGVTSLLVDASRVSVEERGKRGEVVVEDGKVRIWDNEGRLWSLDGLERAIVMRRGLLEGIDPLIKQFVDTKEILERFRKPSIGVTAELNRILSEMQEKNQDITRKVSDSWEFAFRSSRIREDFPSRTIPGTTYALQGIHLQAHQQIGEFFEGDVHYGLAIDAMFKAQLGFEALGNFFEFAGLLLLAVVCPPLAVAVGVGVSLYHYSKALEKADIYKALIDPELIISRAEVEMELFAAQLGLALSFIPEVGTILGRGASTAIRLGVRGSARAAVTSTRALVRGGARGIARALGKRITKSVAEQLSKGMVRNFVEEIATDQVMELVISKVMEPIMLNIEREAFITGPVGGKGGATRALRRLEVE